MLGFSPGNREYRNPEPIRTRVAGLTPDRVMGSVPHMSQPYPQGGIATQARRRIRAILAERDMDIKDLAALVGWKRSTASRKVGRSADQQALSLADVEAIASALGIPMSAILAADGEQVAA